MNTSTDRRAQTKPFGAKKLAAYLSASVGAALASSSDTQAAIVYTDNADVSTTSYSYAVMFSPFDQTAGLYASTGPTGTTFRIQNSGGSYAFVNAAAGNGVASDQSYSYPPAYKLSYGAAIDAGLTFGNRGYVIQDSYTTYGQGWETGGTTTGYVGLVFVESGNTYYGWAQISVNDATDVVTLIDMAYEDTPDTTILAGQTSSAAIPEPSTLALLSAGAAGLVLRRRRKAS